MHRFDSGIDLGNCMVPELDRMIDFYKDSFIGAGNTALDPIESCNGEEHLSSAWEHIEVNPDFPPNKYDPSHYQRGKIQVWDFIADQELDFFKGNVVKYVCRAGSKSRESELDDLMKAKVYVEKAIELLAL